MAGWSPDWIEIGLELRRHGWGPSRVAEFLKVPPSTVKSWFNRGSTPNYRNGVSLIRLHNRIVMYRKP